MNDLINPHAWFGSVYPDRFLDELLDDDTHEPVVKGHTAPMSSNK